MTAATACRTCGTDLREGARFCDGCGAPVTVQHARAEFGRYVRARRLG